MRYEAVLRHLTVAPDVTYWAVTKDGNPFPRMDRPISEAEARIIAFALNAVAEGKLLGCLDDQQPDDNGDFMWTIYEGPENGVAPDAKNPLPESPEGEGSETGGSI